MPTSTKPNPKRLQKPREFFYNDGKRLKDEALHNALIDDGDETRAKAVSDRVARRLGLTEKEIAALRSK